MRRRRRVRCYGAAVQSLWRRAGIAGNPRLGQALRPRPRRSDPRPRFDVVRSQACTQEQMLTPDYQLWAERVGEVAVPQRRQWEWFFTLQALRQSGAIRGGSRGLGIGPEPDPIAPYTSGRGCDISRTVAVEREAVGAYDFAWSISVLDGLTTFEARLGFVRQSLDRLAPSGTAVHTLSFALSPRIPLPRRASGAATKRDLVRLEKLLRADGHDIDCTFVLGDLPADRWVDRSPYSSTHLCAATPAGTVTSYGLLIRKAGGR